VDFTRPEPGTVVATLDGSLTLSHGEHGECYHNQAGAETEARELNVKASGIEEVFASGPQAVLDVGLGLGYNALVTIEAWLVSPSAQDLAVTSLEIDGALVEQLVSGAAPWQTNWTEARRALCRGLRQAGAIWHASLRHANGASLAWSIHVLDARMAPLPPAPAAGFTFVWQDPFSPEKNPEMWNQAWFARLHPLCAPGAVLMTYSVARPVRDALTGSGWEAARIPSRLPPKRQWLRARRLG
jgi:tRNA 5-methylaminomethyl-2-thiouridine biosynthesis bifunctional protein